MIDGTWGVPIDSVDDDGDCGYEGQPLGDPYPGHWNIAQITNDHVRQASHTMIGLIFISSSIHSFLLIPSEPRQAARPGSVAWRWVAGLVCTYVAT